MKRIVMVLLATMLIATFGFTGCAKKDEVVRISHKEYTEQRITGQVMAVYLESKGFEVKVTELTGTMLNFVSLDNGDTDIYPEFTGSAYGAVLDQTEILGAQETYDFVKNEFEKHYGITWLEPLGWNNTYVLSVRPDTIEKYNLETIDDLVAVASELVMGCDKEFQNRADGLPGLKDAYAGLEFKNVVPMDQGLTYAALNNGNIDVNISYSTDGRIAKFGLVNLNDSRNYFPPYYVTPILKMDYAESHPDVVAALEELGGQWTEADMRKYNLMVEEGGDAKEVAISMLQDAGLIE